MPRTKKGPPSGEGSRRRWGLCKAFAARLVARRDARGLSQADLAQLAGLALSAVQKLEQARREPSLSTLLALARALRCGLGQLAGGLDTE